MNENEKKYLDSINELYNEFLKKFEEYKNKKTKQAENDHKNSSEELKKLREAKEKDMFKGNGIFAAFGNFFIDTFSPFNNDIKRQETSERINWNAMNKTYSYLDKYQKIIKNIGELFSFEENKFDVVKLQKNVDIFNKTIHKEIHHMRIIPEFNGEFFKKFNKITDDFIIKQILKEEREREKTMQAESIVGIDTGIKEKKVVNVNSPNDILAKYKTFSDKDDETLKKMATILGTPELRSLLKLPPFYMKPETVQKYLDKAAENSDFDFEKFKEILDNSIKHNVFIQYS